MVCLLLNCSLHMCSIYRMIGHNGLTKMAFPHRQLSQDYDLENFCFADSIAFPAGSGKVLTHILYLSITSYQDTARSDF